MRKWQSNMQYLVFVLLKFEILFMLTNLSWRYFAWPGHYSWFSKSTFVCSLFSTQKWSIAPSCTKWTTYTYYLYSLKTNLNKKLSSMITISWNAQDGAWYKSHRLDTAVWPSMRYYSSLVNKNTCLTNLRSSSLFWNLVRKVLSNTETSFVINKTVQKDFCNFTDFLY